MTSVFKALFAAAALSLAACGEQAPPAPPATDAPQPAGPAAQDGTDISPPPPPAEIETAADEVDWPDARLRAVIVTSKGDMTVELYADQTPNTVANFVQYAKEGHYDRLIIHRVVPGFVIQGGGYNRHFHERPTRAAIPYEGDNGLRNYRSTLAMARTADPNSATSQWFINLRDNNEQLDHFVNDLGPRYGYAVFGRVVDGMAVADAIGALATGAGGPFPAEVPLETVTIARIDILGE
jgi:cyclophilin family peptidyl-prolyl cis-trans isomerase